MVMAIWGFDRSFRLLRVARNGIRTAKVTEIDEDYIRVSIEGVPGDGYAYLYFPTLTWKFWENHPFSVASTILPVQNAEGASNGAGSDIKKHGMTTQGKTLESSSDLSIHGERDNRARELGLTFLLRKRSGLTSSLASLTSLPVLVESSYGHQPNLSDHTTLVCVVGGVGITAVLPMLRSHPGRVRLLWGVRNIGIVDSMSDNLKGISKEIFVGKRMNIRDELEKELGESKESAAVVVSGPAGMADEVRAVVCAMVKTRKRLVISLIEESFSW